MKSGFLSFYLLQYQSTISDHHKFLSAEAPKSTVVKSSRGYPGEGLPAWSVIEPLNSRSTTVSSSRQQSDLFHNRHLSPFRRFGSSTYDNQYVSTNNTKCASAEPSRVEELYVFEAKLIVKNMSVRV